MTALYWSRQHAQFRSWAVGLFASYLHNVDNILRPGTYFTPSWIVKPYLAFPMESGFGFWLIVMILGILALSSPPNKIPIVLHSYGTSFGFMHYVAQDPSKFSLFAHCSILFEIVMGIVVGIKLLCQPNQDLDCSANQASRGGPKYSQVPIEEAVGSVEMQKRRGLRQRSRSPQVTFQ